MQVNLTASQAEGVSALKTKNTKAPGSRVVLYARVSSEEQGGKEHFSIDAQFNEMNEYANEQGWEIVGRFVDEGVSGTKRDRPQLSEALKIAEKKGCDIIMTHDLSRLSRSVYHTLDIFETLGKSQVGFVSVKEPEFDFTDPSKRFFLTILAAINEYYIHLLRTHTKKSKRERSRQGLYNASIMPLGYEHSGNPQIPARIVAEEAKIIKLAYESYVAGRFSDVELAHFLNQRGYTTKKGRRFSKDLVTQILTSPFYMGKIHYINDNGETEIYEGQHKPIIPKDLWEKCQSIRARRRTQSRAVQKKFSTYLLSSLAVCDVCGRTLRGQRTKSGTYYRETSYERGFADCPHQNTGVRSEALYRQINTFIEKIQIPDDWIAQVSERAGDDEELIRLNRQRDRLEAERRRLHQMRMEGDFDEGMDFYKKEMDRIRRESAELPTYDQIETIKIAAKTIGQLYDIWETAELVDRRDLLRLMLREVKVDVRNSRITSITPLAIFVPIIRKIPSLYEIEFGSFVPLWHEVDSHSITNLPEMDPQIIENMPTLPFFDKNPLLPSADSRNTPGIAESLRMLSRKSTISVIQAASEPFTLLPMDLRKWKSAGAKTIPFRALKKLSEAGTDILITQFALWENGYADTLDLIASKIRSGGVWYFYEVLPADFPAHWFYRALPAAWEWVKGNSWSLYTLYNRVQAEFESVDLKRHIFRQSISHKTAKTLLLRSSIIHNIPQEAESTGVKQLASMIEDNSSLTSEFTVIEGWAKKPD
jgi:DNA invertase Pin-like site-specific DNA recombinase